jgi:hypothetical protein
MIISKDEFNQRLKAFIAEKKQKADYKVEGFFANMGFHNVMKREFEKQLAEQDIQVE